MAYFWWWWNREINDGNKKFWVGRREQKIKNILCEISRWKIYNHV